MDKGSSTGITSNPCSSFLDCGLGLRFDRCGFAGAAAIFTNLLHLIPFFFLLFFYFCLGFTQQKPEWLRTFIGIQNHFQDAVMGRASTRPGSPQSCRAQ